MRTSSSTLSLAVPFDNAMKNILKQVTLGVVLAVCLAPAPMAQGAWPSTTDWPTSTSSDTYAVKGPAPASTPIRDINSDQTPVSTDTSSHGVAAATGDWNTAYMYYTAPHLYFRLLVNADPTLSGGFAQFAWIVEIDSNLDGTSDWRVGVDGVNEEVKTTCLATSATTVVGPTSTYARSVDTGVAALSEKSGNMWYVDWQVPLTSMSDGVGGCPDVTASTVIKPFFGTSASYANINKDFFTGSAVDYTQLGYVTPTSPGGSTATGVPVR